MRRRQVLLVLRASRRTYRAPLYNNLVPRLYGAGSSSQRLVFQKSKRGLIGAWNEFIRFCCSVKRRSVVLMNRRQMLRGLMRNKGFSLLELLIVVAIILIIATIAIPSLLRSRQSAQESSAV